MHLLKLKLHWQILIALVAAVLAGLLIPQSAAIFGVRLTSVYDFIGRLFLSALQMLVVPLIATSIIAGVANLGREKAFGRLGSKVVTYYLATSFIAVIIGLVAVNLIRPGVVEPEVSQRLIELSAVDAEQVAERVEGRGAADIVEIFIRMVPRNIFAAASDNSQMLGLITFSIIFGYFSTRLPTAKRDFFVAFWESAYEVMMFITAWIIRFAPIGVFGLVANTVATTGFEIFGPLMAFFMTVLLALALHFFGAMALILRFIGGVSPWQHYRAMAPALLTSFSTASSAATLPLTMRCLTENSKVSPRVTSFSVPLGTTVNMDGTALYECVAAMFIAQIYGIELGFATQLTIVIIALLTSIGVAGVPAASLVAIVVILGAIGLPLEAIGLIIAVDRILDMCRTSVNIFSDSCAAVVIARSEGESGIYAEGRPARQAVSGPQQRDRV